MLDSAMGILVIAGIIVIALIAVGMILARLYRRASKETSYVRTGFGGQKVIMNGGALVLPVLHEIIPVNMKTLRLAVHRANEQALITRDRMRVDVVAEFYVRAQPTADAIANAAQTLGRRTMAPQELKELVEGKFVDALRSVAAEMTMEELHEKRVDFVQKVQQVVTEDLLKNGLELETVSLTGLDQTSIEHFNPQNAFDAEGLTRLTDEIERRKKIRNDIEQDTSVQINDKNLEAEKIKLALGRDEEYARLQQEREIEIRRASQMAEIAKEQADRKRDAEEAEIVADQQIAQARISSERAVEEENIEKERYVRERDIERNRVIETQEVEKQKAVEIAGQDRDIAVAEKSKAQSEARAEADKARAEAVRAEEQVSTARAQEVAERRKRIELIEAAQEAERGALGITIAAEAERTASTDRAEALREVARGDADKIRINAEGEAEAERLRAAAAQIRYEVEAQGKEAINQAANILSNEQITMQLKLSLIENLATIIRESVKPMERIDGIKIVQVEGLTGNGQGGGEGGAANGGGGGNLADQVVNSALRYRAQAPILDSLMRELGMEGQDLNSLAAAAAVSPALANGGAPVAAISDGKSNGSADSGPSAKAQDAPAPEPVAKAKPAPTPAQPAPKKPAPAGGGAKKGPNGA